MNDKTYLITRAAVRTVAGMAVISLPGLLVWGLHAAFGLNMLGS